jgi:excisionase family DNA binding protein
MDDFKNRDIVDETDAARYLKVSKSGLRKWRALGEGPKFYRCGRLIRYRRSDLDAWLESRCQIQANSAERGASA